MSTPVTDTCVDREALAQKVASAFQSAFAKLEEHRADIEELWSEFESLHSGETIMGCRTKTEFCEKVLHRTPRAIQYLLSGGNPVSKRAGRETVSHRTGKLWLTRKQKDRLLNAAAIIGTELLPAYEHGHDIGGPMRELQKLAFDSKELNALIEEGSHSAIEGISYSTPFSYSAPEQPPIECSLEDEILSECRALAKAVLNQNAYAELTARAARVLCMTDDTVVGKSDSEPLDEQASEILEDETLYTTSLPEPIGTTDYPWLVEHRPATPREIRRMVRESNEQWNKSRTGTPVPSAQKATASA